MRNEKTSARVAAIAAKVLAMTKAELLAWSRTTRGPTEIRSLAASCLTQAPDRKPKKKPARRKR